MILTIFIYLLILLGGLFTFKFFLMLFYEKNYVIYDENTSKNSRNFLGRAVISSGYLLSLIYFFYTKFHIDELNTIIPIYILLHLSIWLFLCFFTFVFFIMLPDLLSIPNDFVKFAKVFIKILKKHSIFYNFITKVSNFINIYLNPFSNKKDFNKFFYYRRIKLIFLISYIVSGVALLSFYTNYLEANGLQTRLPSFTREYDLYKNVFVTSLIPFTLNYIFKADK